MNDSIRSTPIGTPARASNELPPDLALPASWRAFGPAPRSEIPAEILSVIRAHDAAEAAEEEAFRRGRLAEEAHDAAEAVAIETGKAVASALNGHPGTAPEGPGSGADDISRAVVLGGRVFFTFQGCAYSLPVAFASPAAEAATTPPPQPPPADALEAALAERSRLMGGYLAARDAYDAAHAAASAAEARMEDAWTAMSVAEDEARRLAEAAGLVPAEPDECSCEKSAAVVGAHVLIFEHNSDGTVSMLFARDRTAV